MFAEFHLAYAFFLICCIKQHKKAHSKITEMFTLFVIRLFEFVKNSGFICFGDFHFLSLLISGAYKCVQIDSIISVLPGLLFVIQMSKSSNKNFYFFFFFFFGPHPPCSVWCW